VDINVTINYPKDLDALTDKAIDIMSDILIKKLSTNEVEKLINILKDDSLKISW
jgi:hypothetical protein